MQSLKYPRCLKIILGTIVCIFLVWYLYAFYQWHTTLKIISEIDILKYVLTIAPVYALYIFIRTVRWWLLIRERNPKISFLSLYSITFIFLSLALVTPAQLGEVFKIETLKRLGQSERLPGIGSFLLERLLDLVMVIFLGILGLLMNRHIFDVPVKLSVIVASTGAIACVLIYLSFKGKTFFRGKWITYLLSGCGSPKQLVPLFSLTLVGWLLTALAWDISLKTVDVSLSCSKLFWLVAIVALSTVISFIPAGIGISEISTIYALTSMNLALPEAQSAALILRLYGIIVVGGGVFYAMCVFFYRKMTFLKNFALIPRIKINYSLKDIFLAFFTCEKSTNFCEQLTVELEAFFRSPEVLLTASGRGALYVLLSCLPHHKVLIPAYTCKAVVESAILAKKEIFFVETAERDYNMSPKNLAEQADVDTIILATHQFGFPCRIEEIMAVAKKTGAFVIEDAAASLGSRVNGQLTGTFAQAAFFSFDTTKLLNTPLKGGCILTRNHKLADQCRDFMNANITLMSFQRKLFYLASGAALCLLSNHYLYRIFHNIKFKWQNKFTDENLNHRSTLGPFYTDSLAQWQARILLSQIKNIDEIISIRQKIYSEYLNHLTGHNIDLPPEDKAKEWAPIRFPIRVENKLDFYKRAVAKGVDFSFSFTFISSPLEFSISHYLASSILDVPFYKGLTHKEFITIIQTLTNLSKSDYEEDKYV
jgi:dTDP-4-amino-4,6-dideoxygalactose transaminase/uncharacterized membrane protein YbhN (UPF0104 family)